MTTSDAEVEPSLPRSSATFGSPSFEDTSPASKDATVSQNDAVTADRKIPAVTISSVHAEQTGKAIASTSGLNGHGTPVRNLRRSRSSINGVHDLDGEEITWGANFWVTLVNPQVCGPATFIYTKSLKSIQPI